MRRVKLVKIKLILDLVYCFLFFLNLNGLLVMIALPFIGYLKKQNGLTLRHKYEAKFFSIDKELYRNFY